MTKLESIERKNDRIRLAIKLKEELGTWTAVGSAMGISGTRAKQLAESAIRITDFTYRGQDFECLSVRARNCLKNMGYTDRASVYESYMNGDLYKASKNGKESAYNLGKKTYQEICGWLGVDPVNKGNIDTCIRYLERNGYIVTKI